MQIRKKRIFLGLLVATTILILLLNRPLKSNGLVARLFLPSFKLTQTKTSAASNQTRQAADIGREGGSREERQKEEGIEERRHNAALTQRGPKRRGIRMGNEIHSEPQRNHNINQVANQTDLLSNGTIMVKPFDWIESSSAAFLSARASLVKTATTDTLHLDALPYLENFHNPCWIEKLPHGSKPYTARPHRFENVVFNEGRLRVRLQFSQRRAQGKPYRMRCVPYFYILGPQKTGTTDLYNSLLRHPAVVRSVTKETHWWARSRLAGTTLQEYADLFDQAAETIATNVVTCNNGSTFHPFIIGDASPELIWDNYSGKTQPENHGVEPEAARLQYLTPHHIHHVTPQARFIAMLRNPIDRLWSDYNYFRQKSPVSMGDYTKRVTVGLRWLTNCFEYATTSEARRLCMYERVDEYGSKYGAEWNPVVRLRMGMYAELLQDWFSVFQRDHILILNMADYATDRLGVVNTVLRFLGLDAMPEQLSRSLRVKHAENAVSGRTYNRTGPVPRDILQQLQRFYQPFNQQLVEMTGNRDFLAWNTHQPTL